MSKSKKGAQNQGGSELLNPGPLRNDQQKCLTSLEKENETLSEELAAAKANVAQRGWLPSVEYLTSLENKVRGYVETSRIIADHTKNEAQKLVKDYKPGISTLVQNIIEKHKDMHFEAPKSFQAMRATVIQETERRFEQMDELPEDEQRTEEPEHGDLEKVFPEGKANSQNRAQAAEVDRGFSVLNIEMEAKEVYEKFKKITEKRMKEIEERGDMNDVLTLKSLNASLLNDFNKNMDRCKQKADKLGDDPTIDEAIKKIDGYKSAGQSKFDETTHKLKEGQEAANARKIQEIQKSMAEILAKIRETSDEYTGQEKLEPEKELDLHGACVKKMRESNETLKKVKCPEAIADDKQEAMDEAESCFQKVHDFTIEQLLSRAREADETFSSTFEGTENMGDKMRACQFHVDTLKKRRLQMKLIKGLSTEVQNTQDEAVRAVEEMTTKVEKLFLDFVNEKAVSGHKDFVEAMEELDKNASADGVDAKEWQTEFQKHAKYEEFLSSARKALPYFKTVDSENTDKYQATKALIDEYYAEFMEAKKSYKNMDAAKKRKQLKKDVHDLVTLATSAYRSYELTLSSLNEDSPHPDPEELKKVKETIQTQADALAKLKSEADEASLDIFEPAEATIKELDPDKLYREATEAYDKLQFEKYRRGIESLVARARDGREAYDQALNDHKINHRDPGTDDLDKILGLLNDVEFKLKEMVYSRDAERQEVVTAAKSYFTKCREEVKKMNDEAYRLYLDHKDELERQRKALEETLKQKGVEAEKSEAKFVKLMQGVNKSPGQGPNDEEIVRKYHQEAETNLRSIIDYLKNVTVPMKELQEDVKAVESTVDGQLQNCRKMFDDWSLKTKQIETSDEHRYTLKECGSSFDALGQDPETGLVCSLKTRGLPKNSFTCGTVKFHDIDTLGQELASNVINIENKSDAKEFLTTCLPYEAKGVAPYKEHHIIYHDKELGWHPLKSVKTQNEGQQQIESNLMIEGGKSVTLAVALRGKRITVPVDRKAQTVISPSDKKVKAIIGKNTFSSVTPFTLQSVPVTSTCQSVSKSLLKWSEDMALNTSPLISFDVGEAPEKPIQFDVPMGAQQRDKTKTLSTGPSVGSSGKRVAHTLLKRATDRKWHPVKKEDSDVTAIQHSVDFDKEHFSLCGNKAIVIQTASNTKKEEVVEMAETIEATMNAFVGRIIVKQHEENLQDMYLTLCHQNQTEKMDTKLILQDLASRKYNAGPEPSEEFKILEGEKINITTDKNITFAAEKKNRSLTFHSNIPSPCVEEKLQHKDEFAQSSFSEYRGVVVCSRRSSNKEGDKEICRLTVMLPKNVNMRRGRTFHQARNTNVVLTDEFLKGFVKDLERCKGQLEEILGLGKKDIQKLDQKFPDDPQEQIFHMIRDKMKTMKIQEGEKMANELVVALKGIRMDAEAQKLQERISTYNTEKRQRIYEAKMTDTRNFMTTGKQTPNEWKEIYRGVQKNKSPEEIAADIQEIEGKANSPVDRMGLALTKWQESFDQKASGAMLVPVLRRQKCTVVADKIQKVWNDWTI